MELKVRTLGTQKYVQAVAGTLRSESDVTEVIGRCGELGANRLLLEVHNLTDEFFDLKTGQAGVFLQKFMNYHVRVALVLPLGHAQGRFAEMALEANRGRQFHIFHDTITAEQWLFRAD